MFFKLHGAKSFSTLNVTSGYYSITVDENSRKYTAFTAECGKYEFLSVPFGIHITQCYFAMMISETFKGLDFCFAYSDDIIIFFKTENKHLDHIRQVFIYLYKANIKLKLIKCDFSRLNSIILEIYFLKKAYHLSQKNRCKKIHATLQKHQGV